MITLTDKAIEKIKEISEAEGIGHFVVRAKVIAGGCAGFEYDLQFDDQILDLDEVVEVNDVKVIIDPVSTQYLEECVLDYLDTQFSAGFKFINPNVKNTCGCGSSVGF